MCKELQILSPQIESRHNLSQVDEVSVAAEGLVPVQVQVVPRLIAS